jgi:hypothetical protein
VIYAWIAVLPFLIACYAWTVRALWLRYGGAVHGVIWRAFIAVGQADDRLNAQADASAARVKAARR